MSFLINICIKVLTNDSRAWTFALKYIYIFDNELIIGSIFYIKNSLLFRFYTKKFNYWHYLMEPVCIHTAASNESLYSETDYTYLVETPWSCTSYVYNKDLP